MRTQNAGNWAGVREDLQQLLHGDWHAFLQAKKKYGSRSGVRKFIEQAVLTSCRINVSARTNFSCPHVCAPVQSPASFKACDPKGKARVRYTQQLEMQ